MLINFDGRSWLYGIFLTWLSLEAPGRKRHIGSVVRLKQRWIWTCEGRRKRGFRFYSYKAHRAPSTGQQWERSLCVRRPPHRPGCSVGFSDEEEWQITLNRLDIIIKKFPNPGQEIFLTLILTSKCFWTTQKSLISRAEWWQWWYLKVILLNLSSADQRWPLTQHLPAISTLLLSKPHLFTLDS